MSLCLMDSHCHLDHFEDLDQVLKRAQDAQVGRLISICVDQENFKKVLPIAESHPHVFASVGVHPCHVDNHDPEDIRVWLKTQAAHPKVVGLGETGLDFMSRSPHRETQVSLFKVHINVALTTGLPLIVHLREAEEAFLEIMSAYPIKPKGVLHCFTGSLGYAQAAISWGWKVSLSGIVTFSNAKALQEVVRALSITDLLVETDAPWLAPQPHRGKRNEPAYVAFTARKIAELKGISFEEVVHQTSLNAGEVFGAVVLEPLLGSNLD